MNSMTSRNRAWRLKHWPAGTATQAAVVDAASAQSLMLAQTSLIKRPVVDWGQDTTVGFDAAAWSTRL